MLKSVVSLSEINITGMKKTIALLAGVVLMTSVVAQSRVIHGRLTVFNTYPV